MEHNIFGMMSFSTYWFEILSHHEKTFEWLNERSDQLRYSFDRVCIWYKLRIFCWPPISAKSIFGLKLHLLFIDRFGNTLIYALILIQKTNSYQMMMYCQTRLKVSLWCNSSKNESVTKSNDRFGALEWNNLQNTWYVILKITSKIEPIMGDWRRC